MMDPVEILYLVYVILLGMILGSFLGLATVRIPLGESLFRPRSHCRHCDHTLRWYENVPIFSYLFLRGKCSACGEPISPKYFIIELVTTAMTVAAYLYLTPFSRFVLYEFCLIIPMLLLMFLDWEAMVLPDVLTLPGIFLGVFTHWAGEYFFLPPVWVRPTWKILLESLIGAMVGFLTLFVLAWAYRRTRKREGLGGGDIKLAAMIGAFFGWRAVFFIFFLGSVFGTLFGLTLILLKRSQRHTPIPFGSFLAGASLLYLFFGPPLIGAYLSLFKFN
jgi:leader peptidase (prepilin peptidase)/N-methyltransferase